MWVALCSPDDEAALWACQGLRTRGLEPLELVTTEMLEDGVRWKHMVGTDVASVEVTLSDGRIIRSENLRGVLNRLLWIPSKALQRVSPADQEYAIQELSAFFMSWLHALPSPVLNRPTPQGLSGQWLHISEWVWLASKAGLPTSIYKKSSREPLDETVFEARVVPIESPVKTIIVVEESVVGALVPPEIRDGCQRLADLAKIGLLGVDFAEGSTGSWTFVGASTIPDLRLGGEKLLDVLASVLKGKGRQDE